MSLLSNLITVICGLINLLSFLIIIRSLISWLPLGENNKFASFLITMTEPIMLPIRRLLSKFSSTQETMIDFSPMIAILALWVISGLLGLLQNLL